MRRRVNYRRRKHKPKSATLVAPAELTPPEPRPEGEGEPTAEVGGTVEAPEANLPRQEGSDVDYYRLRHEYLQI